MLAAAAAAGALHAATQPRRRRSRARCEDQEPVWLLFINLGSLQLAPNLASSHFQVRLRYGGNGRFRERFSQKVRSTAKVEGHALAAPQQGMLVELHGMASSAELNGMLGVCQGFDQLSNMWMVRLMTNEVKAVTASNIRRATQVFGNLDAMLIFPWSPSLEPQLTFSLRKLGLYDTTIAEATVTIPFISGRPGLADQELLFLGKRGCSGFVGQLGVTAELRSFPRADFFQGAPGDLDRMLNSLEPVRMPPGHLGPNSMAGRPAVGTPMSYGGLTPGLPVDIGVPVGMPVGVPEPAVLGTVAGGAPVVLGRPVPGEGEPVTGQRRT